MADQGLLNVIADFMDGIHEGYMAHQNASTQNSTAKTGSPTGTSPQQKVESDAKQSNASQQSNDLLTQLVNLIRGPQGDKVKNAPASAAPAKMTADAIQNQLPSPQSASAPPNIVTPQSYGAPGYDVTQQGANQIAQQYSQNNGKGGGVSELQTIGRMIGSVGGMLFGMI